MVQHGPHVGTNDIDKALRQAHDIDTQDTIHVDVLSPAMSDTVSDLYGFRLRHEAHLLRHSFRPLFTVRTPLGRILSHDSVKRTSLIGETHSET